MRKKALAHALSTLDTDCLSLFGGGLALARLLRKFFQNLRYGRERPKVARKLRSLAGGWAPLYGRAAAEEIFSEVI